MRGPAESGQAARPRGALALVLHAHLPYVEGFGTWPFGEEWLFEAVAAVYLTLLGALQGQAVTVGLSPVLCDQFETLEGEAGARLVDFLSHTQTRHEIDARSFEATGERALAGEIHRAATDYSWARRRFDELGGRVLEAWRGLTAGGRPSLMTSAATHAVLPLVAMDGVRRLQVASGIKAHKRRFGRWDGIFWLPECAYSPDLQGLLATEGVTGVVVDQTKRWGTGAPEHLTPIAVTGGAVAFPLDWQSVALVWDETHGYPTASAYRDHHHRRTLQGLKPWSYAGTPYDHDAALELARQDARDFVDRVIERLERYATGRQSGGLVCCAFDAELFGHWWYEGVHWLREVLAEASRRELELVTLPEAAARFRPREAAVQRSTWAVTKDFATWDGPAVADLTRLRQAAERALTEAVDECRAEDGLVRAARELLGLEASDWAFLATRGTAGDYPRMRALAHAEGVERALAAGARVSPRLRNLAPDLTLEDLRASVSRRAA
jgi:1,4-alpha-glucan branching enzyme